MVSEAACARLQRRKVDHPLLEQIVGETKQSLPRKSPAAVDGCQLWKMTAESFQVRAWLQGPFGLEVKCIEKGFGGRRVGGSKRSSWEGRIHSL
jgi:hypothetical protein